MEKEMKNASPLSFEPMDPRKIKAVNSVNKFEYSFDSSVKMYKFLGCSVKIRQAEILMHVNTSPFQAYGYSK